MVIRLFIAFFALFSFVGNSGVSVAQVNPEIIVKVDPQQGTIADEFVLSVVLQNVDSSEAPRLESSKDFEVQPIGPQSQVTIVNGVVSRRVVWRFRLRPTHEGTLQPPQVTVDIGGDLQVREPRAVIVTKSAAAIPPQAQLDGVELVQRVDRSPVYLGQQLIA